MGYTHYWSYDENLDKAALSRALLDAKKITDAVQQRRIVLRGGLGKGEPEISEWGIWLNGDGEKGLDHETFAFPMTPDMAKRAKELHGGLWDFTKTARKPYDLAVCAILLVLKHHLGNQIRIASDGDRKADEWLPAEDLVSEVLGYDQQFAQEDTIVWRQKAIQPK